MADLVVRNAVVIDGTGAAGFEADVAVSGDRITTVGTVGDGDAAGAREVDAGGRVLAPGFVDVHTHDDGALLRHPGMEFKLSQGCTSLVIGNCGFSAVPAAPGEKEPSGLIGVTPTWSDLAGFRAAVTEANPSVNAMALVGHNTSRALVMGKTERRAPTPAELDEMRSHVRAAMEQGAGRLRAEKEALATEGTLSLMMVDALNRPGGAAEDLKATMDAIKDRLNP